MNGGLSIQYLRRPPGQMDICSACGQKELSTKSIYVPLQMYMAFNTNSKNQVFGSISVQMQVCFPFLGDIELNISVFSQIFLPQLISSTSFNLIICVKKKTGVPCGPPGSTTETTSIC